jgi:hypothetical protein
MTETEKNQPTLERHENPFAAPQAIPYAKQFHSDQLEKVEGHRLPAMNRSAVLAFYLGILGLIPVLGVPIALAAIAFGMHGIYRYSRRSEIGGLAHACVGVLGGLASLLCGGGIVGIWFWWDSEIAP